MKIDGVFQYSLKAGNYKFGIAHDSFFLSSRFFKRIVAQPGPNTEWLDLFNDKPHVNSTGFCLRFVYE